MASAYRGREHRRAPRIDVLMRVKGQLVEIDTPIVVHDLSRSGFAVVSPVPFDPDEMLDFRLVGADGSVVTVSAQAMHTRPWGGVSGLHLSGFMFVPGPLTGLVPQSLIDRLIETVTGVGARYFETVGD